MLRCRLSVVPWEDEERHRPTQGRESLSKPLEVHTENRRMLHSGEMSRGDAEAKSPSLTRRSEVSLERLRGDWIFLDCISRIRKCALCAKT